MAIEALVLLVLIFVSPFLFGCTKHESSLDEFCYKPGPIILEVLIPVNHFVE